MNNEISLKDAINKMIDAYKLRSKFDERMLISEWGQIAGKLIEKHTTEMQLEGTRLLLKLDNPVAKQELMFIRTRLIEVINRKWNKKLVDEIVILL